LIFLLFIYLSCKTTTTNHFAAVCFFFANILLKRKVDPGPRCVGGFNCDFLSGVGMAVSGRTGGLAAAAAAAVVCFSAVAVIFVVVGGVLGGDGFTDCWFAVVMEVVLTRGKPTLALT
jgi:hypothetical protein